jgi:hypothetical protein
MYQAAEGLVEVLIWKVSAAPAFYSIEEFYSMLINYLKTPQQVAVFLPQLNEILV